MEALNWHKSSRSNGQGGDCVEVADNMPDAVYVRDTKDRTGPILSFARDDWAAFIAEVRERAFNRP